MGIEISETELNQDYSSILDEEELGERRLAASKQGSKRRLGLALMAAMMLLGAFCFFSATSTTSTKNPARTGAVAQDWEAASNPQKKSIKDLQVRIDEAAEKTDYARAAELQKLKQAVEKKDYARAAELQDKLKKLKQVVKNTDINAKGAKGVQLGDHNKQVNNNKVVNNKETNVRAKNAQLGDHDVQNNCGDNCKIVQGDEITKVTNVKKIIKRARNDPSCNKKNELYLSGGTYCGPQDCLHYAGGCVPDTTRAGAPDGLAWYSDRNKYIGQWKGGKKSGRGTMMYKDGSTYIGHFKDNLKSGHGIYTWRTHGTDDDDWTQKYEGEWKNDHENGHGTWTWKNGQKYDGEFRDGHYNGYGVMYAPGGVVYQKGQWKHDKFVG